jgi:hypothetical protein
MEACLPNPLNESASGPGALFALRWDDEKPFVIVLIMRL